VRAGTERPRTSVACSLGVTAPAGSALSQPWEFPASALHGRAGAENGHDAPSAALRALLAAPPSPGWPAHGYLVLRRTSDEVLYGHVARSRTAYADVTIQPTVDLSVAITRTGGRWLFYNGGGCTPSLAYPGRQVPWFTLQRKPDRNARAIDLVITTGVCTAAQPSSRLDRVLLSWSTHRLLVTVLLRPDTPPPGSVCPSVAVTVEVKVRLPRPLGGRAVYDGALVPATPAKVSRVG
jgi:hypothetical protein